MRIDYTALSEEEKQALEERIEGWGWLADSARRAGVHVNTIRNVLKRGYGEAETVNRIRNTLLS